MIHLAVRIVARLISCDGYRKVRQRTREKEQARDFRTPDGGMDNR